MGAWLSASFLITSIRMPDNAPRPVILVVDDDRGLLRLIEKALAREGFETATAASGKEAIAWLATNWADLLLLDLKLQDMDGKALIDQFAGSTRHLPPFIIITGQGDERAAVEMMKRGALDYLIKDVRFIEIVPALVQRAFAHIEARKRLELAERQARLTQTLVEQGYSGAVILEAHHSNPMICYANPAFASLIGAPVSSLIGSPFSILEEYAGGWEPITRALVAQSDFKAILQLGQRKGEERSVRCRMSAIYNHGGEHTHWAVVLEDVTKQQRLERELLGISDREQTRIGQDLHDNLGQKLTAVELFFQGLISDLREQAPKLLVSAGEIGRQLQAMIRDVRTMSHVLSPASLGNYGLQNALHELAHATTTLTATKCEFACDPETQAQDVTVATHLYRIAQEAVNNAVKHSGATKIKISLKENGDHFDLAVEDNGQGFTRGNNEQGIGLGVMEHRASLIGASLEIQSKAGTGTSISCHAPMKI